VLVTPCTSEETEFLKVRRRWCASAKPAWLRLPMEEKSSCMCQLIYIYIWYITIRGWARLAFEGKNMKQTNHWETRADYGFPCSQNDSNRK
jgi:hypothetical protein